MVDIDVLSSNELVWAAWTIADRVKLWFAPDANVEAKLGGAFELFFIPGNHEQMNTKGCKITELVPMERLSFTWKGPDDFAGIMNNENSLTVVTVTLMNENKQTKVTIEHAGWGEGEEWEKAYQWHVMAWNQVASSLKSSIESGKGDLCCVPSN